MVVIHGEMMSDVILKEADISHADAAIALTNNDKVAAFGRTFYFCFKGGSGAADMMAVDPVQPYEAMKETDISLDEDLAKF